MTEFDVVLTAAAVRSLQRIPARYSEALVEFIFHGLADQPRRRGKPLQNDLTGRWSARRGDFRVIYRLDDENNTMIVLKIAYRADAYRP